MRLETTVLPPSSMPNGLQVSEDGMWVIDQLTEEISLLNSRLETVHTIPTVAENASGIAFGGGYFWLGSNAPNRRRDRRSTDSMASAVLQCDGETGELVARFPTPDGGGIHGLEWVDGLLWITAFRPKALKIIDPDGFRLVRTLEVPHQRLHGLSWDGDGMWTAHTTDKLIVKYDPLTGEEMDRIEYPHDAPAPHGLTRWDGDLWSCDAENPSLSRIVR